MATIEQPSAEKEMAQLLTKSEDALLAELGLRIEDMKNVGGYVRSQSFAGAFSQDAKDQLGMDDLRKIGKKFWPSWSLSSSNSFALTTLSSAKSPEADRCRRWLRPLLLQALSPLSLPQRGSS